MDDSETPLHEIVQEVQELVDQSELIAALNSASPIDDVTVKDQVSINDMMNFYEDPSSNHTQSTLHQSLAVQELVSTEDLSPALALLSQAASEAAALTQDDALIAALKLVNDRISVLKEQ